MDGQTQRTKNEKVGLVVSAKMQKTIVVEVMRRVQHPLYKRVIRKRKRFHAHDEENSAKVGDMVRIIESRPLSRLKRWRLGEVIRRAVQVAEIESAEKPTGNQLSLKRKPAGEKS
jgi:small subunit ribosomal protein S17